MILDTSALVELQLRLSDYQRIADSLNHAEALGVGAPTLLETTMVLLGRGIQSAVADVDAFLKRWSVVVIPFGVEHWPVALDAFARYGKGRHPARLNFGDCLTYAIAKLAGEPLLCLGDDFRQTDLPLVLS